MITFSEIGPRAVEVRVEGKTEPGDVERIFDQTDALIARMPRFDLLAEVTGPVEFGFGVLAEELHHGGQMLRLIKALDRVALVADQGWMRAVARVEGWLIPGIDYRTFTRAELDRARAFVLRTDSAAGGDRAA